MGGGWGGVNLCEGGRGEVRIGDGWGWGVE